MKSEEIKEITSRAVEQLAAALEASHSETLAEYLKVIARFHGYSLCNVLLIASPNPLCSWLPHMHCTRAPRRCAGAHGKSRLHPPGCAADALNPYA
jgi:hypothetical protein